MIEEKNGVTIISKDISKPPEGIVTQPKVVGQEDAQFMEQQLNTQEPATPIEGTETASLAKLGAKEFINVYRSLFKKTVKEIQPPKKFIEQKQKAELEAFGKQQEPADLVDRKLEDYDDSDSYQMNFNTLENEDDVNGMIAQVAEFHKKEIDATRGGIQKDEEILKLADVIGADPKFVQEFVSSKNSEFNAPEKILAARKVLNANAARLKKLADAIYIEKDDSTNTLFEFKRAYAFQQQFMTQFMGKRANVGRSLRAFGVPVGSGDEQLNAMKEMLQTAHSGLNPLKAAQQISLAQTVKGVNLAVDAQQSLMRKAGNVFMELFINSILSGIKTQVVNTTGTAMMVGMRKVDTFLAARLGTPITTDAEKVLLNEWKAQVFGEINSFSDAFHTAMKVAKTGEAYGGATKLESAGRQFISGEYLGIKGRAGAFVDALGEVVRTPTERVMGSTDAWFKKVVEGGQISQLAYRKATYEANARGLDEKEALQLIQYYINNPTQDMLEEAVATSLQDTFQIALKQGSIGQKIQQLAGSHPALQFMMPFVKTPTNLLVEGFLRRTPLGLASKEFQDAIKAGGAKAQMAMARMITGSSLGLAFGALVLSDKVTGSGGSNWETQKTKKETGWRPYSIKFTDEKGKTTYVSYKRLEPFSYIWTTMADLYELQKVRTKLGEDDSREIDKIMGALMLSLSNATLDRTFMVGVQNILEAVNSDNPRKFQQIVAKTAAAIVPSASRDIARMFDDSMKITDGVLEEIKAKTPYWSKSIPTLLDSFGNEVKFDTILSPLPVVEGNTDKILAEMARLADSTQQSPTSLPQKTYQTIRFTSEQYHDLILLSRKKILINGLNYKQTVALMMSDPNYDKMIDEDRVAKLRQMKSKFDKLGRYALAQNDKKFMGKLIKVDTAVNAAKKAKMDGTQPELEHLLMQEDVLSDIIGLEIEIVNPNDKKLFYNKEK